MNYLIYLKYLDHYLECNKHPLNEMFYLTELTKNIENVFIAIIKGITVIHEQEGKNEHFYFFGNYFMVNVYILFFIFIVTSIIMTKFLNL